VYFATTGANIMRKKVIPIDLDSVPIDDIDEEDYDGVRTSIFIQKNVIDFTLYKLRRNAKAIINNENWLAKRNEAVSNQNARKAI
jgi:hypothetical protein